MNGELLDRPRRRSQALPGRPHRAARVHRRRRSVHGVLRQHRGDAARRRRGRERASLRSLRARPTRAGGRRTPSNRSPFRITTTVLPSWPETATGSLSAPSGVCWPRNTQVTSSTMTPDGDRARSGSPRGARCLQSRTAYGSAARSSPISTTSALSMRGVAADAAHHDADRGARQRRRVVDAVADHRHGAVPAARARRCARPCPRAAARRTARSTPTRRADRLDGARAVTRQQHHRARRRRGATRRTVAAAVGRDSSAAAITPHAPPRLHDHRGLAVVVRSARRARARRAAPPARARRTDPACRPRPRRPRRAPPVPCRGGS